MLNKSVYINIGIIFLTTVLFFIFKENFKIEEKISSEIKKIKEIKEIKEIKSISFTKTYTGSISKKKAFDLEIDLKNIVYSGTTVDVFFSNNPNFISYKVGSHKNKEKVKFGFMIGKVRNRNKLIWVGRVVSSLKVFNYRLNDIQEEGKLSFKTANIEGGELFFKIIVNGLKQEK